MTAPDARQRCRGSCLSAAGCAGPLNTALGTSLGTPILDREVAVLVVPPEFARRSASGFLLTAITMLSSRTLAIPTRASTDSG